ncbi:MAG: Wzz/FepE/Etk N-terminal domain-containing protein [Verrucomicrobiota bacterium]
MLNQSAPQPPSLGLGDIYYILFRHKWKIAACFAAGIAVAAAMLRFDAPQYFSEAKLLVRYIIAENKMTGPNANSATAKILTDERGASIMATEREILSSVDLAEEVTKAIGPEKILANAGGGKDLPKAVKLLRESLSVNVPGGSSVIFITFRHPDFEIVQPVLREVLDRYLKLHVATHRTSGMLTESLTQEADTLRGRLAQTEQELRRETNKAGVISLESAKESYAAQIAAIRREIGGYEAELAGRIAVLEQLKKRVLAPATTANTPSETATEPELPVAVIDQYRTIALKINRLQSLEQELAVQFTTENERVKTARAQLNEAEAALKGLREQYPRLSRSAAVISSNNPSRSEIDPSAEEASATSIQIISYQAKIKELSSQYERLRAEASKLDQMEGTILELRRKKELEEANYRYYAANLEQARINETLGNGKVSNISQIQAASPAFREQINFKKPGMALLGGLAVGLVWAFLIELYFDRSVRRPGELSQLVRAPLFLSIPKLKAGANPTSRGAQLALTGGTAAAITGADALEPPSGAAALLPFHETLRDRLISFFESKNLTHKPKLVAVTGVLDAAGVTTTAAGLARSLSETGEGNVLLVDMTVGAGAAQQFMRGKAVCGLDEMLEARSQAHVHQNLYVVAESNNSEKLTRNLPKRFARLIPQLKASDFDYIIFDMPKVTQLSITPRLASFMDMVLLVVESEKTDRTLVQGACDLLDESKVNVGIVLNKTRQYVPSRMQQELMST